MNKYDRILYAALEFYNLSKVAAPPRVGPSRLTSRAPMRPRGRPVARPAEPHAGRAPATTTEFTGELATPKPRVPKTEPSPITSQAPMAPAGPVDLVTRIKQSLRPKIKERPIKPDMQQYFHLDEGGKVIWNKEKMLDASGNPKPEIKNIRQELRQSVRDAQANFKDMKRSETYKKIDEAARQRKYDQNSGKFMATMEPSFRGAIAKLAPKAKIGFAVVTALGGLYMLFTGKSPEIPSNMTTVSSTVNTVSKGNLPTGAQLVTEITTLNQLLAKNPEFSDVSGELKNLQSTLQNILSQKLNLTQGADIQNFAKLVRQFDSQANSVCQELSELNLTQELKNQSEVLTLHLVDFIDNISASRTMRSL